MVNKRRSEFESMLSDVIHGKPARLKLTSVEEFFGDIGFYISSQLEHIGFASFAECSELSGLISDMYEKQINEVSNLANIFSRAGIVFVQGFCRNSQYSDLVPVARRGDIDVLISRESAPFLYKELSEADYGKRGFNSDGFFDLNKSQIEGFESQFWADKELCVSRFEHYANVDDFPFEIDGQYQPLVRVREEIFITYAIEPHFSYLGYDLKCGSIGVESWIGGLQRIDATTSVFLNIVRLSMGIPNGENRLRVILEIACALRYASTGQEAIDIDKLNFLFASHAERDRLYTLCEFLSSINDSFSVFKQRHIPYITSFKSELRSRYEDCFERPKT